MFNSQFRILIREEVQLQSSPRMRIENWELNTGRIPINLFREPLLQDTRHAPLNLPSNTSEASPKQITCILWESSWALQSVGRKRDFIAAAFAEYRRRQKRMRIAAVVYS